MLQLGEDLQREGLLALEIIGEQTQLCVGVAHDALDGGAEIAVLRKAAPGGAVQRLARLDPVAVTGHEMLTSLM